LITLKSATLDEVGGWELAEIVRRSPIPTSVLDEVGGWDLAVEIMWQRPNTERTSTQSTLRRRSRQDRQAL
jgi:hypothetical protein